MRGGTYEFYCGALLRGGLGGALAASWSLGGVVEVAGSAKLCRFVSRLQSRLCISQVLARSDTQSTSFPAASREWWARRCLIAEFSVTASLGHTPINVRGLMRWARMAYYHLHIIAASNTSLQDKEDCYSDYVSSGYRFDALRAANAMQPTKETTLILQAQAQASTKRPPEECKAISPI